MNCRKQQSVFRHFRKDTKMDRLLNVYISATKGEPVTVGIITAVLVLLVTILFFVLRSGSDKKRAVLLVGLSGAGKTLIFSRLIYNKFITTQTSIKENSATYILKNKSATVRLVDLPGYDRLRTQYLDRYKTIARAVVFVVDSMSFQKDVKDVAEYLYTLLTDPVVQKGKPKLLIACNKSDVTLAKGSKVIQRQLEKEINLLRVTQSAALDSTSGSGNGSVFLGKKGKDFQFEDIRGIKVDFVECSARGSKESGDQPDLVDLEHWFITVV